MWAQFRSTVCLTRNRNSNAAATKGFCSRQPPMAGIGLSSESRLGACLLEQKKYAEAEPIAALGVGRDERRDEGRTAARNSLRRGTLLELIVRLYRELGKNVKPLSGRIGSTTCFFRPMLSFRAEHSPWVIQRTVMTIVRELPIACA